MDLIKILYLSNVFIKNARRDTLQNGSEILDENEVTLIEP